MTQVLELGEYPLERVFEAQDLYCVERLTYEALAARTGIGVATLKRWGQKYGWRQKRTRLAEVESQIALDLAEARARMLGKVITGGEAQDAFAVAALEKLVMDQARFRAQRVPAAPPVPAEFEGPAQAAGLLEKALAVKLGGLLAAPASLDLKTLKDLKEALALLREMKAQAEPEAAAESAPNGLSEETEARIRRLLEACG